MATRSCFMAAATYLAKPCISAVRRGFSAQSIAAPLRVCTSTLQSQFVASRKPVGLRMQTFVSAASTNEAATASIYVGNLPFSITDADLREWFQEIGEVSSVRIGMDQYGKTRGFAHVDFVDPASAQKAISYDGEELNGRALRIDLSAPRAPRVQQEADGLTCFVKGFDTYDEQSAREALMAAFAPFGEIKEVVLPTDRDSGALKGFGYVVYTEANGANEKAAEALQGQYAAGGRLTTDPNATSQRRAPGGRGAGAPQHESDGKTIFVKGFDAYLGEDSVRDALTQSFSAFGEVAEVRLPVDRENACLKGFGYVVFANADGAAAKAAVEMAGAECGGGTLFIDANPRPPRASGGRGGGRGGDRRGGGYGGDRRGGYSGERRSGGGGGYGGERRAGGGGRGGGSYERRGNSGGYDRRGSDRGYGDSNW